MIDLRHENGIDELLTLPVFRIFVKQFLAKNR
jgi:hypothetical protein